MASRDPTTWMWAQACELLEEAERMHRQFFRLGLSGRAPPGNPRWTCSRTGARSRSSWRCRGYRPPRRSDLREPHDLVVRAERRIPFEDSACSIGRLEIPYGHFERRIPLPAVSLEPGTQTWADGCLILTLRKRR